MAVRLDHGPPLFPDHLIFRMVLREEFQGSEAEPGPTKQQAVVWDSWTEGTPRKPDFSMDFNQNSPISGMTTPDLCLHSVKL